MLTIDLGLLAMAVVGIGKSLNPANAFEGETFAEASEAFSRASAGEKSLFADIGLWIEANFRGVELTASNLGRMALAVIGRFKYAFVDIILFILDFVLDMPWWELAISGVVVAGSLIASVISGGASLAFKIVQLAFALVDTARTLVTIFDQCL